LAKSKTNTKKRAGKRSRSAREISEARRRLGALPDLDKVSELLNVAGSATRLKLLYLLEHERDLPVGELADRLEVSVPAVCQHLGKLRAYGLVTPRRQAQIVCYRLTDHPFNETLRAHFF
jgi:DNA-binding transcriptional ArsR family regulator